MVPQGSYALEFTAIEPHWDIFDWFWGPYLNEFDKRAFGIVPNVLHRNDYQAYVQAYAFFAQMLADHALDLEVLPRVVPREVFFADQNLYKRLMTIFIGGA